MIGKIEPEHLNPKILHFKQEVIIGSKPFIFEGDIPEDPEDFTWLVSVSNWDVLGPRVEAMLADLETHPRMGDTNPRYVRELKNYGLGDGKAGILEISRVTPRDNALAIGIKYVQTETRYFPEDSGYRNTQGIGSFLLDNLCALADIKKWRIYLFPDDRGGRLTQEQISIWYVRRGFEDNYRFPKEAEHNFGTMQRWPKEPDLSRVVATILQSVTHGK